MQRILRFLITAACLGQLLLPALGRAEDGVRVLVIRPQRLPQAVEQAVADGSQRDPFSWPAGFLARFKPQDPEAGREAFAGLTLQSVIWDRDNPQAIINGRLLSVGDTVEGAVVERIDKDSVLLGKNGYEHTLEFAGNLFDFSKSASEAP